MTNTESLELVDSAITECENELGKLDQYTALVATCQKTVEGLETTISELHSNKDGLEQKARASRLTNAKSLLDLERADLAGLVRQIDRQSDRVVQVGQRAQSILQQVWSAVLQSRRSAVETMLRTNFDFRAIHTPASEFSSAAYSVLEVEEIKGVLFHNRWLPAERELAIDDARKMRERSAGLIAMASNEPDLVLDIVNVELTPVVRPRQATTSNQSGTLNVLAAV